MRGGFGTRQLFLTACLAVVSGPAGAAGGLDKAAAHFISRNTIAWPGVDAGNRFRLYFSSSGELTSGPLGISGGGWLELSVDPGGLTARQRGAFPALAGAVTLKLAPADLARVPALLKGQLAAARFDDAGRLLEASGLQIPGVLDDLFAYRGALGAVAGPEDLSFALWAPTAQSVRLHIYDGPAGPESAILPMREEASGVWRAPGEMAWVNRKYYAYEVRVFAAGAGRLVDNTVADPYSLGAAAGSSRSLIVDLEKDEAKPRAWDETKRPPLAGPQDIVLYELHVRDFSASDASVPAADRGKFRAFTHRRSGGMRHLAALQSAGLTHIHLLPSFEIASVADLGCETPAIPSAAPDSSDQQAALAAARDKDCFNWGYDPVLYTVPNGSYTADPNGLGRIVEFRGMVQSLHRAGLRVVMDVVYNHTAASGQDELSILDKIVPGYYHRLDANGRVETATCCRDTATEHAMMGKLLTDSVLTWAREYRVDGFRFDLMGFHPKALLVDLKEQLARIDPQIYLYGEGWDFGPPGNDALFTQASQANMAGTGIGTFNDRLRDAARGGGAFDAGGALVANQGFINGLWYDPNAAAGPATPAQRDALNHAADLIRLGISGTPKDLTFTDRAGNSVTGAQLDYDGRPAGYAVDPPDVINYVSAHDNMTLFDNDQLKVPIAATMADRVRVNSLGVAIVLLSQGVPFFHAGDELLRSKSLDANSYNGGDWFNRLDFTYRTNNWGVGLPPAEDGNKGNWPVLRPFLANATLRPSGPDIAQAAAVFRDFLRVRKSSPLFRLKTGADVRRHLTFYNVGPDQTPGLIVFGLADDAAGGPDPRLRGVLVAINAGTGPVTYAVPQHKGRRLRLHPVQAEGADAVVKASAFDRDSGSFTIPGRTVAVFVEPR